ncbi:MAG: DUF3137 domain-containing protein [Patescibacteria group bacterium]|nr:DUF3137 domain-containing protein [Patescibacteria group bacterium]
MFYSIIFGLLIFIIDTASVFARGGGGGSSGGGGGGGFGGGSFSSGTGGSGSNDPASIFITIAIVIILIIIGIYQSYSKKQKLKATQKLIKQAEATDPSWDEVALKHRVTEVFMKFQQDWSDFNTESMKEYLTEDYYQRMYLELNVLKSEKRQNLMSAVSIHSLNILKVNDNTDNSRDSFVIEVNASAHDKLIDTSTQSTLYTDNSSFTEYWNFFKVDGIWKLGLIEQSTADFRMNEQQIIDFARNNKFFYDPDFGWLMMPNHGVIFSANNFKNSDINNHVIGLHKDKIVEFYTFIPNTNSNISSNYVVAQTILPISYKDILVRKKRTLFNFNPNGLRRIKTESNDFDRKFCLWANKEDQISSFELLSPDFMEKIYELPFELNIEIVGNFLYLYAKSRSNVSYDKMLEILSSAFDEMKM